MAHATSIFSSQMEGAPKPKKGKDPAMYRYRDILNDVNVSKLMQMENILRTTDQNDTPSSYDEHSKNYGYKNAVMIYGDTTNQVILCLAWFFLVVFMMDAGFREMKRRYRLQQFMNYSMQ